MTWVLILKKIMLNIGKRPTITDNRSAIEVYIFDFSADIYGADIKVEFVKRIRDEKRFNDLESKLIDSKLLLFAYETILAAIALNLSAVNFFLLPRPTTSTLLIFTSP